MNVTTAASAHYVGRVTALVEAEIARQQGQRNPRQPFQNIKLWMPKGSAGKALGWFVEIAEQHPDADPQALAQMLDDRVESEIEQRPRWYTKSHLRGVVAMARAELPNTDQEAS